MQTWSSVGGEAVRKTRRLASSLGSTESLPVLHKERLALIWALTHPEKATAALECFTLRTWRRQLPWLDTSGLALYLFGSLCDHGYEALLPASIQTRLEQNLLDNSSRMGQLADEAYALHRAFHRNRVRYATLKGFSLHPVSVPQLERRSQLDLDFLIAEDDIIVAREVLESSGYILRAVSGRSWEFKKNECADTTLRDLYKPLPYRCVELHLEYNASQQPLLPRLRWQQFRNIEMPVLHPADLFLGQGLHLAKHIGSEFFRVAHVYEFRRHIVARYNDDAFWREVCHAAGQDPRTAHGLGVAVALITRVTGQFAPHDLTVWTSDRLPEGVQRWIDTFAMRVTLGGHPGNKLYLLLQEELARQKVTSRRTVRESLIPRALPPRIAHQHDYEMLYDKVRRNRRQFAYILSRLYFHIVEGVRYLYHAWRWKRVSRGSVTHLLLLLCICLCLSLGAHAQQDNTTSSPLLYSPSPQPQQVSAPGQSAQPSSGLVNTTPDPANSGVSLGLNQQIQTLSVDQITVVLQNNPDALVEVKQLLSDLVTQQGQAIAADSISDQMLYARIATSPDLRANITVFLQSRGYISDADIALPATGLMPDRGNTTALLGADTSVQGNAYTAISPGQQPTTNKPDEPPAESKFLHRPTPYNLRSLHDLYSQVAEDRTPLKRFGAEMFLRRDLATARAMSASSSPDVGANPSYVLGPGDSVTVQMWGGISQSITRTIDREGGLALPEAGVVQVSGLTLTRAQDTITTALKHQFRNVEVVVSLGRLRSIRVYVVGDVQRPGAYEISAIATPISALYAAGGPTAIGSLRILRHYRGTQLVGEIDLYDFLLQGVQAEDRLQAGDTLLVPPAGPQVAISGAVKRPAIYELKEKTSLSALLDDAGTATVTAELTHITIDRVRPNQERETVDLNLPSPGNPDQARTAIAAFNVQDGDRIRVAPLESYSQRVVYTEGHVLRPGRTAFHDGMRLSDVIPSYRDLLPEPADRGEIVRLVPPDLHVETIEFNVPDVMIGNNNVALQPFDTVRIFSRYEVDAPRVSIGGEVLHPGTYSLSQGMTASQLVRMAGGFTRGALLTDADLTSYTIVNGTRAQGERTTVRIGDAVTRADPAADVVLKAGDVLNIHKLTGWDDIGASITLEGEVAHPGRYGFQQGEHLSAIIRRAGGFRDTSYPDGAVFTRPDVKVLEERSRQELIRQIETSSSAARLTPSIAPGDSAVQLQLVQAQQDQILSRLKSQPATGRLVIHISADIASWENTPADVEVRADDVIHIPKRPGFVLVDGQVYNASAITFAPGKTAGWYLGRAGGATEVANKKEVFVIRANGSVVGRGSGGFLHRDVLDTRLEAGDVVVVPQKIIGASLFWRNLLSVAQITSSIAITAAVAGVL